MVAERAVAIESAPVWGWLILKKGENGMTRYRSDVVKV